MDERGTPVSNPGMKPQNLTREAPQPAGDRLTLRLSRLGKRIIIHLYS